MSTSALRYQMRSAGALTALTKALGPDRLPDALPTDLSRIWLYAGADFELAALDQLIREGFAANKHVDYPSNYGEASGRSVFRLEPDGATFPLRYWATGPSVACADGEVIARFDGGINGPGNTVVVPPGCRNLEIAVLAGPTGAAALAVPRAEPQGRWSYRSDEGAWLDAVPRPGGNEAPHTATEGSIRLSLTPRGGGLYALDAPVLGRVFIEATSRPVLSVGESLDEALADDVARESRCDVVQAAPGLWMSEHRLGFRYAVVRGADPTSVTVHANVRPAGTRGAFLCDDPVLNRVWATSAYTLRLCMQVFLLDGIKRDRMPWMGDNALGVNCTAYAFGNGEVIRNTLIALGRPTHGYVNGIADYSLWWLISHGLYQRHFADRRFLSGEAATIDAFLSKLARDVTEEGIFRPRKETDAFPQAGPGSVFIDWGVRVAEGRDSTALQMLWYWAVDSAATLLGHVQYPTALRWRKLADQTRSSISRLGWDDQRGTWKEYLDSESEPNAYANFLAVLSGISGAPIPEGVRDSIDIEEIGTPFMRYFALQALGIAGRQEQAVNEIRTFWGGMLEAGASSFWEEFDIGSATPYEMYGRPFGKSLSHAWSAGPAALLPELVLGARALTDGWASFTVEPRLGSLTWAAGVVPVPAGAIVIHASCDTGIQVDVPAGCALVSDDRRFAGPCTVSRDRSGAWHESTPAVRSEMF